ncbi:hypothetical protein KBZ21_39925, partial [Streptomyces sp. A73]|nr:hypothetical protein [Streptomyces sp. A73]
RHTHLDQGDTRSMTELAIRQNGNTPALTDEQPQHPGSELVAWTALSTAAGLALGAAINHRKEHQ